MRVLFVSSGNSKMGVSPIIKNQGESLRKAGIDIEFFTIIGKGANGYLKAIPKLRNYLKENNFDVIHAHFSLSAYVASLALAKPLIVSLMGSDVKSKGSNRVMIKIFQRLFWSKTIVKSDDMRKDLQVGNIEVIPNGIDIERFKTIDKNFCTKKIGWDPTKKHVLFAANPNKIVKNFEFAKRAFDLLKNDKIELHFLDNVSNALMPFYFNAAHVVLLTSKWEGSPNVIKEAMACNIPIVSTNVGDVKWLLKDIEGCYITKFDENDCALKLQQAIDYSFINARTMGRNKLNELELDEQSVGIKIIKVYNKTLQN